METLGRLTTDHGERSAYDAVSQCSRCGYCEQACPTYIATGKESFSGRGRNQIVRMLLEGKLTDFASAREALDTCLLCGACTSACYAHVRTADLVLEGRRLLSNTVPWSVRLLTWLMERHMGIFKFLLHVGYTFKRWGISRWLCRLRIPTLLGIPILEVMDRHVERVPDKFLSKYLRNMQGADIDCGILKTNFPGDGSRIPWAYFAPCGPNFLFPQVGLSTVVALGKAMGPGTFLDNPCCGLLAYNYGSLDAARRFARRNIEQWEGKILESSTETGPIIVGDCSSCVAHLKGYPQLFLEDPIWRDRARRFSERVRDVAEIPREKEVQPLARYLAGNMRQVPRSSAVAAGALQGSDVVTYHDSCRARNGEGIVSEPREQMRRMFGERFVELPRADECCGGAGAFAFAQPELSDEILRRKIGNIASIQARLVVTSSTSCLIQLVQGLKKYYPECEVIHLSQLGTHALQGEFSAYSR